jgi:hypothetical protein
VGFGDDVAQTGMQRSWRGQVWMTRVFQKRGQRER